MPLIRPVAGQVGTGSPQVAVREEDPQELRPVQNGSDRRPRGAHQARVPQPAPGRRGRHSGAHAPLWCSFGSGVTMHFEGLGHFMLYFLNGYFLSNSVSGIASVYSDLMHLAAGLIMVIRYATAFVGVVL